MQHFKRLFTTEDVKGTKNYLDSQKKYELIRTLLYFGISAALFISGWLQTKSRVNLLTVVAILGCLPASKSAVSAIMFFRFKSCDPAKADRLTPYAEVLSCLYDCVFTSYRKNYRISHLAVRGNTVCGLTEDTEFDERGFYQHIGDILKLDGHKDITVKIFNDFDRYTARLEQMRALEAGEKLTGAVIGTLKNVML